jgi:CHAD domain-containing protein
MAFLIEAEEKPLEALARIIAEQGGKLEAEGEKSEKDPAAFVHKARVRCKRIRALLLMAKPAMGSKRHRTANRWWRDAARMLSEARDATAQTEALKALHPALVEAVGEGPVRTLAARLRLAHRLGGAHRREGGAIREFRERIAGREPHPLADPEAFAETLLADGIAASYRASRRAMKAAFEDPHPEAFHEWRKQAKAHGLQLRVSRIVFPRIAERVAAVRELAECLGHIQDVEVLLQAMKGEVGEGIDPRIPEALEAERRKMQAGAEDQGHALFGEKLKAWTARALDAALAPTDL